MVLRTLAKLVERFLLVFVGIGVLAFAANVFSDSGPYRGSLVIGDEGRGLARGA